MSSLVLLKREWPKGIYVTEGKSGSEVLSRLGRQADDLSVQVLAELPGLEENPLRGALEEITCVAGWYECGPGAVFTALASVFERVPFHAKAAPDAAKHPSIRFWRADRELIQRMREEVRGAAHAAQEARELTREDRKRIDALLDVHRDYKPATQQAKDCYDNLRREIQGLQSQLSQLVKICTPQKAEEKPKQVATHSLFGEILFPRSDGQGGCKTQRKRVAKLLEQTGEGFDGSLPQERSAPDARQDADELCPTAANQPVGDAAAETREGFTAPKTHEGLRDEQAGGCEGRQMDTTPEPHAQSSAVPWVANASFESIHEDLSDVSSIDGHENPRHRELKLYAKARRLAKARMEPTLAPDTNNGIVISACSKEQAETAASIRQQLRETLGDEGAARVLALYQSKIMRDRDGKPQRFLFDFAGSLVGLAQRKNVALQ